MTEIIEEPMRGLMVTLSAWERLRTRAEELAADKETKFAGLYILHVMEQMMNQAEADLREQEKLLKKQIKEEKQ